MSPVRRILSLLKPHTAPIAAGFACLLVSTGAMLVQPMLWQVMVDRVLTNQKDHALFWPLIVGMIVLGLSGAIAGGLRTWLLERTGQRFVFDLRKRVYAHLQSQPLAFFHERRTGDLISRVVGDVDTVQDAVVSGVDTFIANILGMLGVSIIMIWYNWKLGLLTVCPVFLTFTIMYRYNQKVKPVYRAARDKLGDVSARLQENLTGVHTVKAFAREEVAEERFQQSILAFMSQNLLGISLRSKYLPAVQFISFVGSIVMIGYGGYLVVQQEVSLGVLLAYRGYWWHLYGPVYSIAGINDLVQRASASSSRIFELLDHAPQLADAPDARELPRVKGAVRFDNVAFSYAAREGTLRGIDLDVPAGARVGLVGSSGSGKSTLLGLIPRFYDPQAGRVLIDGTDVRTVTQKSLRRQMAMVLQESFLFNDSVLENIRFGRPAATREEAEQAARAANAHEFISELPQGYDTLIGERGVKLSGGQRQRLAIARAFLADPAILLLDEATSAVEAESEAVIQQALDRLMAGRTAFLVSHRLSVIRPCDIIVVIEDGKIAERGTHTELLERNGLYAQMYRMQMGAEVVESAGS